MILSNTDRAKYIKVRRQDGSFNDLLPGFRSAAPGVSFCVMRTKAPSQRFRSE